VIKVIIFIILIIFAIVYAALPLWAKLIVFAINSFFPDPIPVIDEILMIVAVINDISKIYKATKIAESIRAHKLLSFFICIMLIVFLSSVISMISR
jgi:hypothetical protein